MARQRKATPPRGYVIYDGPSMLTGERIVCIATVKSKNGKTGPMLQTWILCAADDPVYSIKTGADISICGYCDLRGDGTGKKRPCYVQVARAPLGIWNAWKRGIYPVLSGHAAIAALGAGRKVRLGAYGDPAAIPSYVNESLVSAAAGHTAYSHQSAWSGSAFDRARMMVSADSLAGAESAWAMGARTFRVVGAVSELVRGREILCPAAEEAGKRTQCASCLLCGGASVKAKSIAIVAHGAGRKHHATAA